MSDYIIFLRPYYALCCVLFRVSETYNTNAPCSLFMIRLLIINTTQKTHACMHDAHKQELRTFSSLTSSSSGRYRRVNSTASGARTPRSPHSIPEDEELVDVIDLNVAGEPRSLRTAHSLPNPPNRSVRMVNFDLPDASWDGSGGNAGSSDGQGGVSFPRSMSDAEPGGLDLEDPAAGTESGLAAGIPSALWNPARVFDRVQYGRSFRFLIDGADNKLNPSLTVGVKVPVKAYTEVSRSANFLWMVIQDARRVGTAGAAQSRPRINTGLIGMLERLERLRTLLREHDVVPPPFLEDGGADGGEEDEDTGGASHLAILTTPAGRRTVDSGGEGGTQGHSAALIYGVEVASGRGAVACSPSVAAQTIHEAEVAVTTLALSRGEPDTVAMTFSFLPLGFLFYLLRGGSHKDGTGGNINGNAVRGVMRGAIMGNLTDAEYEEFAIAMVEYIMAKFGIQTLITLCRRKVVAGRVDTKSREDLYALFKRFVESDLAEPEVEDTAAEVNADANPMMLRPQMASLHQRLKLYQDIQATHGLKKTKKKMNVEEEDNDDPVAEGGGSGGNRNLVAVRHRTRMQKLMDVLVCRRKPDGGAFFGLFPPPIGEEAAPKKKSGLIRKLGDDYDPYEKIEVSVMDNITWTWRWLMQNEKMSTFVIFMLIQYLALWAAGGFYVVEVLFDSAVHDEDTSWMWSLIAIMVAGSMLSSQIKYVMDIANPSGAGFVPAMQVHMLRQLGRVRMEFLDVTSSTEVMNILENEIPRISENIDAFIEGFANLWQMIATLALCGTISPGMTGSICCLLPFFAILGYRLGKAVNKASADLQARENMFKVEMNENLSSNSTKKLLGLYDFLDDELVEKKTDVEDGYDVLDTMMAQQDRALTVLETALKLIVIITGTLLVATYNSGGETEEEKAQAKFLGVIQGMDVGNFVAFYMASETVGGFIVEISKAYRTFSTTAVALEMLLMLDYKLLDNVAEHPEKLDPDQSPVLEAKAVNFVYRPPGGGDWRKAPLLFRNINIVVQPGKKVGIVGKSGSGKSTLCKLISRLYSPTAGEITVAGISLRDIDLYSTIAMMEQETLLFDDSVKGNLTVGNENITMAQIEFCCKTASVHADIIDMEGGYDYKVGVRGRMLSGGQRQRIALARTLLRNCPISIMDEPTSAQEPAVTAQIGHNLSKWQYTGSDGLKYPGTILGVTHNYPFVDDWDLIMVFQNGNIVEYDSKATLLARKGRFYRMMNSTNGLMVDGMGRATITAERLAQIWLFAAPEIPIEELQVIAESCQTRHISANDTLFNFDDEADAMYVLVQGQIQDAPRLENPTEVVMPRVWDAGDVVGELNLLPDTPKPWGTDAIAKSRAILLHLPKALFAQQITEGEDGSAPELPIVREVVRELSYQVSTTRSAGRLQLVWPFCGVNEDLLKVLGELMDIRVEEPENMFFNSPEKECDTLFFMLRGRVAVSSMAHTEGGSSQETTTVLEGGTHFGEDSLMYNSRRLNRAKTLEQSIILSIDRVMFSRYVAMVRTEFGEAAADDITKNLTNYRRFTGNPGLLPLAMWPLAMLNAEQLDDVPELMNVTAHAEGSQVCVMKESDDEAHIILRGTVVVQIMRSESLTVSKEIKEGDVVNAVTLCGDAGRFGELVLSAECTEPTVLLTISRNKLWSIPKVNPDVMSTVALQRHLMTTPENLNNIGLNFLSANGKDAVLRELVETKVYTQDKVIANASENMDSYLIKVVHGFVSISLDKGTSQMVKPGQYVVTTGRTQPRQVSPGVVMVRDAATVTAASPYVVVVVMDMGRVSEEAEVEQRRMEEKLRAQNEQRKLIKERLAIATIIVRAMEIQLGMTTPQHPRVRWKKALNRIKMMIAFGLKEALLARDVQGMGTLLSAEAAGSLQVELARMEQRQTMLQKDLDERQERLHKLMARWEDMGILHGEDPTGGGTFVTVEEAIEEHNTVTLLGSEAMMLPGLVSKKSMMEKKENISSGGGGRPTSGRPRSGRPTSGRNSHGGGDPPSRPESQASDYYDEDEGAFDSFKNNDERLSDRFVRRRLQKVPYLRKNYPQMGEDSIVGHWMITDVEDTMKEMGPKNQMSKKAGLSMNSVKRGLKSGPSIKDGIAGTVDPLELELGNIKENALQMQTEKLKGAFKDIATLDAVRAASRKAMIFEPMMPKAPKGLAAAKKRPNVMHRVFVFKANLCSERLTEMSRILDEKERTRKVLRDTELKRLDKLIRRNGKDQPKMLIETKVRNTLDALRKLQYNLRAFNALYAALAEERKMLVPHYRAVAARISDLWAELKVPPTSRMQFKLNALDEEVDEFLLDKLEKELARLEDVSALLSPLFAEQRLQEGQPLNFDQAYAKLQQSLQLMGDPVPSAESCLQAGIETLRETAEQAAAECAQRQEQMTTALSTIRNYWNSLSIPILEQMSFNDTDLSLMSLSKVNSNLASLEKTAEQRSMQRDQMVVSMTNAWRILKTRKEVQERILKSHIGLQPQVLASLNSELNKVNKVVKEFEEREEIVHKLEVLWAKLRFPSGETRWARNCLYYHIKGSKELLEKEAKRLNALLKIESKATQAQIMAAAADIAKAEKEILRLQRLGYQYQVASSTLAVAVASERVNEFTAIQMALAAPVKVHLQVLDDSGRSPLSVQCRVVVKKEVNSVESSTTKLQSLLRSKLARKNMIKLRATMALEKESEVAAMARDRKAEQGVRFKEAMAAPLGQGGPVNIQPIAGVGSSLGGPGGGSTRPNTSGTTGSRLDSPSTGTRPNTSGTGVTTASGHTERTAMELEADEKNEMAKNAREDRVKREMQQMNRAIAEIRAIYKELKIPEAEINQKLKEFSVDATGGAASVGGMLDTITQEITLAQSRLGIRDSIKALQTKLPKAWKKAGIDGEMMLQRLSMAITQPIDVKLNVDAEIDVLNLLAKSKKFYGNKKNLNMPDIPTAILKHISAMSPLERQAVLKQDAAFVKMTDTAQKLMKKAKMGKAEQIDKIRKCVNAGLGEPKMEALRQLMATVEAEIANQKKLKEEELEAKKAAKKAGKGKGKKKGAEPEEEEVADDEGGGGDDDDEGEGEGEGDEGDDEGDDDDDDDDGDMTEAEGGNETDTDRTYGKPWVPPPSTSDLDSDYTDTEDEPAAKAVVPKPEPSLTPVPEWPGAAMPPPPPPKSDTVQEPAPEPVPQAPPAPPTEPAEVVASAPPEVVPHEEEAAAPPAPP